MFSSDTLNNHQEKAIEILSNILDTEIDSIAQLGGGKNCLVYQIKCSSSQHLVSKFYFSHQNDPRDRLSTEYNALRFLWKHGVRCIPEPLILNREYECGIYECISGQPVSPQDIRKIEIDQTVTFLLTLKQLSHLPESQKLQPASEACFSFKTVFETVEKRMNQLERVQDIELQNYLKKEVKPAFFKIFDWCKKECDRIKSNWNDDIDMMERTLSPSDFGFHNTLRRTNGEIVFIDFEYFGWDDPGKMVSDFLLHPGFKLNHELKKYFVRQFLQLFPSFEQFLKRIRIAFPMHGLNWSLRMLNEYLPEHSSRRQFAAGSNLQMSAVLKTQLNKSKQLLKKISNEYRQFAYE